MPAARKIIDLAKEKEAKKQRELNRAIGLRGMYPLNAPGMPGPGPDFLRVAQALGDDTVYKKIAKTKEIDYRPGAVLEDLYKQALRRPGFSLQVQTRPGQFKEAVFVTGHIWGEHMAEWEASQYDPFVESKPVTGPHRADVMVVGKMPWKDETEEGRNFVGDTGEILIEMCKKLHIKGLTKWYVTNLLKFMPPDGSTTLRAGWIDDCLPLLHQELRIVRPRYILFLGADASKEILGKKFGVGYMEGRVVPLTYPVHADKEQEPQLHTAQCMTVIHPAQIAREPTMARTLERGLARFANLIQGADFAGEEEGLDHRVCTSLEEAEEWTHEASLELADEEPKYRLLAIDAEWEGQHPVNQNAWIATVQISWADKKSICFHLRDEEGKVVFRDAGGKPAVKRLAKLLNGFVNAYRVVGHFLVSDLEMLCGEGFDFRAGFEVPFEDDADGTPAWMRCMRGEGGLDTAMMAHAVEETAMLGLEHLLMRYTTCPRYDIPLEDAVQELCKKLGVKRGALEGYGKIPRDILVPYANYDADGTRRLAVELLGYLDNDYEGNNCWEPFWESMIIQPVILEIHQNGMYVDRKRVDELTHKFMTARAAKEDEIKKAANWESFNIRSVQHVKEYLFGMKLNGKRDKEGDHVRIRPRGAHSLKIKPLLTTDKPPKKWEDVEAQGKEMEHNPSTGKAVLAILAQEQLAAGKKEVADAINQIRDYRFLDQVLKSMLRPPVTDEAGNWLYESEDLGSGVENLHVYDAGLASCVDDDGMVRTHLYPTAETGRWKSARPNLQNISKTRDPDYFRLLGFEDPETRKKPIYDKKLRSILTMPPRTVAVPVVKWRKGRPVVEYEKCDWVGIESDLKGAELAGMAIMAGAKKMIEHSERANKYPEEGYDSDGKEVPGGKYPHPEYYDIHSNVAILAFKLKCHPSKQGLKDVGKAHIRNIAKTVIFGLCYGRGAKAIALAAKEQGVDITVEEVEKVIAAIFQMYPELVPLFAECRERALNERWLCHCFGRFRRFPPVNDFKLEGEFERQAMNYPIQGMIASLVDRWAATLHAAKRKLLPEYGEEIFQWQLQIHDALVVRCKPQYVEYVADTLIPWAVRQVPIYPTRLDGSPVTGRGPYHLGVETEVFDHWGERLKVADCERLSIPTRFGKG